MIEIIPAMDIIGGRCVRLEEGDFSRKTEYPADPLEVARRFEASGLTRLHMVDLDGAKAGEIKNLDVLRSVAAATSLVIDFSGGIRAEHDLEAVFAAGAKYAAIGSAAVKQPDTVAEWIMRFGAERFLLGADVRGSKIAVSGWQDQTAVELNDHIRSYAALGVHQVFVTDISRDGLLTGPAIGLYRDVIAEFPDIDIIASGGVTTITDITELDAVGCRGVIIGKALYEGRISLEALSALH